jgi:hypothetical protein
MEGSGKPNGRLPGVGIALCLGMNGRLGHMRLGQMRGRAPGIGMPMYVPGDEWKVSGQMRWKAPGVGMPMYLGMNGRFPGR